MADDVILETEDLTKEFHGFLAVKGVRLRVCRGAIHALIGPNGAGKTTCFNLLTHFLSPTRGRIRFNGRDITGSRPADIARLGLVRSFQISAVFPHLTVLENVRIGLQRKLGTSFHFWKSARTLDTLNARAIVETVQHRFGTPEIEGRAVLALQRDPHVFQRREVREHRRNLERTHQPEPRDIGRRHRRDVLSLVVDRPGRRLQELGQEVEARRFPGPVRTDQRVNMTTTDLKLDIANGKKPREFLGQSLGLENELIRQTNFPLPGAPLDAAGVFLTTGLPRHVRNRPEMPPPGGICRHRT